MGDKLFETLRDNAKEGVQLTPFERTYGTTMFKYMHTVRAAD